jgi:alpha-L-fucosidase
MKGAALYAFVLGWPEDGRLRIRSLARSPGSTGRIRDVRLLGSTGKVTWSQNGESLAMRLPAGKPSDHAVTLKITGANLRSFKPTLSDVRDSIIVVPDTAGNFVLQPRQADLHGTRIQVESRSGKDNIGFWDSPNEWAGWALKLSIPASYQITAQIAASAGPSELLVEIDGRRITVQVPATAGWDDFGDVTVGRHVLTPGPHVLTVKAMDAKTWKPINLREVRLTKPR